MRATFNAVATLIHAAADMQVAMQKAAAAKAAEVMTAATAAVEEITAAVEGSALPGAVKRINGLQTELQAVMEPHLPAIMAAAGPLNAATEALKAKWKALTATDAEKAAAEADVDEDESDDVPWAQASLHRL